jgi:hypothetical protein
LSLGSGRGANLLGTALVAFATSASALANDQLRVRLSSEAPRAWATLEEFSAKLSGTIEIVGKSEEQPGPGEPNGFGKRDRIKFLRNGNWTLMETHHEFYRGGSKPAETRQWVSGMNSRYGFGLSRQGDEEKWVLAKVTPAAQISEYDYLGFIEHVMVHLRSRTVSPEKLGDYLRRDNLRIREVAGLSRAGKNLVQVKYVIDTSLPSGVPRNPRVSFDEASKPMIVTGELLLDPERYWSVQESRTDSPGNKIRDIFDYNEIDGLPVLRRHEFRSQSPGSSVWYVETADYKDMTKRDTPEYEFSVSAYGLPEIDPAIKRPTPVWVWCLIGAGVTGIMAFATRWYARRRAVA